MICHVCGSELEAVITDMPFKVSPTTIVVVKELPVLQCTNCPEYLLEDPVMERLEQLLDEVGKKAELEVVRFAA